MKIFHYTDLNGLKGIVGDNSFWATNVYFLNDERELRHGIDCLNHSLGYLNEDLDEDVIGLIRSEINKFDMFNANHQYNISFCQEPDLLSQWRGYGASQGVCLEFDSDDLIDSLCFADAQQISGSVIYTKPDSTPEAKNEIINLFNQEGFLKQLKSNPMDEIGKLTDLVYKITPFFKHSGFSEEKEFRIVIQPSSRFERLKFRVNAHGLIPYLEIKAKEKNKWQGRLPLKSVRIGPCKDRFLMAQGIEFLLYSKGYKNVSYSFIETPFRG